MAPEQVGPSSALIPGKQVLETYLETLLEILSLSLRKKVKQSLEAENSQTKKEKENRYEKQMQVSISGPPFFPI